MRRQGPKRGAGPRALGRRLNARRRPRVQRLPVVRTREAKLADDRLALGGGVILDGPAANFCVQARF